MRKILFIIAISALFFTSCANNKRSSASVDKIMDKIKEAADFSDSVEEDLTKLEVAERYGIAVKDIEAGKVYYTKSAENIDKIILVKSKDQNAVGRIERALGNEIVRLNDTWSDNETEYKKIRNHILKTNETLTILIISDNPKKIEALFDMT